MREIVTLQFGQHSNYLATHFWNTQESYFTYPPAPESPINHDILFRPGLSPSGTETFTPRTLIYDLKGSFGSMRKINALYEPTDDRSILDQPSVWPSKPILQKAGDAVPLSRYQEYLDNGLTPPKLSVNSVRYWSDYNRVFYHPKSIVQLSEFEVSNTLSPFEKWEVGAELFDKLEREIDIVDADLRPFVEECDCMQGLQVFTGVDDAWGGWACGWMERIRDEFGKMSVWTWGVGEHGTNTTIPREKRLKQTLNSARSLHLLGEHSSLYIPLSNIPFNLPPYLSLNTTSPWHIAALQAAGIETLTIPSRLHALTDGKGTLPDLADAINSTGKRRIAKLEMSVADPDVLSEKALDETTSADKAGSMTSRRTSGSDEKLDIFDIDFFTREYRDPSSRGAKKKREHRFGRAEVCRGEWNPNEGDERDAHDRFRNGMALQRFTAPLLFPLLDSFPSIFDVGSGHASNLAVHTGLTTSTAIAAQVRAMEGLASRLVGTEEQENLRNGLQTLAEEYDEGWSSGEDSTDDGG